MKVNTFGGVRTNTYKFFHVYFSFLPLCREIYYKSILFMATLTFIFVSFIIFTFQPWLDFNVLWGILLILVSSVIMICLMGSVLQVYKILFFNICSLKKNFFIQNSFNLKLGKIYSFVIKHLKINVYSLFIIFQIA